MEYPGLDERIVFKRIFREPNVGQGIDFGGIGLGPTVGCCECVDEKWGTIKT